MSLLITKNHLGTTWVQEIVSMILNGADEEALKDMHLFFRFPFLEMNWASHYSQVSEDLTRGERGVEYE